MTEEEIDDVVGVEVIAEGHARDLTDVAAGIGEEVIAEIEEATVEEEVIVATEEDHKEILIEIEET